MPDGGCRRLAYGDLLSLQRFFKGKDKPLADGAIIVAIPRADLVIQIVDFGRLNVKCVEEDRREVDKDAIDDVTGRCVGNR